MAGWLVLLIALGALLIGIGVGVLLAYEDREWREGHYEDEYWTSQGRRLARKRDLP